jgi:hypothetical protein
MKNIFYPLPGSLDKKEERRFHLLPRKRWHLLPPFLSNEPGTHHMAQCVGWQKRLRLGQMDERVEDVMKQIPNYIVQ